MKYFNPLAWIVCLLMLLAFAVLWVFESSITTAMLMLGLDPREE